MCRKIPVNNAHFPTRSFPAIILAAGLSRRMGSLKALLPIAGQPMIRSVVKTCIDSKCVSQIVVITGHESLLVQRSISLDNVTLAFNPDYEAGEMLSSVQTGIRALNGECNAFFLLPCDQPLVQATTFIALAEAWHNAVPVVIPVYKGKRGHPVLISTALGPEILALQSGDTLKSALVRHRDSAIEVAVDDPGILFDVDTPEEYELAVTRIH